MVVPLIARGLQLGASFLLGTAKVAGKTAAKTVKGVGIVGAGILGGAMMGSGAGAAGASEGFTSSSGARPNMGALMSLPGGGGSAKQFKTFDSLSSSSAGSSFSGDNLADGMKIMIRELAMIRSSIDNQTDAQNQNIMMQSAAMEEASSESRGAMLALAGNQQSPAEMQRNSQIGMLGALGMAGLTGAGIAAALYAQFGKSEGDSGATNNEPEDNRDGVTKLVEGVLSALTFGISDVVIDALGIHDQRPPTPVEQQTGAQKILSDTAKQVEAVANPQSSATESGYQSSGEANHGSLPGDNGELRALISYNEGTTDEHAKKQAGAKSGYDITLDYGRWTPDEFKGRNITDLTFAELKKYQEGMRTPENRKKYKGGGSSAVGKYQIVGQTLFGKNGNGGLFAKSGLKWSDKFTPENQDLLANILIEEQRKAAKGDNKEYNRLIARQWSSLKNYLDNSIGASKSSSSQVLAVTNRNFETGGKDITPVKELTANVPEVQYKLADDVESGGNALSENLKNYTQGLSDRPNIIKNYTGGAIIPGYTPPSPSNSTGGERTSSIPPPPEGYADQVASGYATHLGAVS